MALSQRRLRLHLDRLAGHHSADPSVFVDPCRHLPVASQMTNAPWKCAVCRRLVKKVVEYCPGCGGHWIATQDSSYHHNASASSSATWEWEDWNSWEGGQARALRQRSQSRQRSTSRKQKEKGKGHGGKQGKAGKPGKGSKNQDTVLAPSPFAPYPMPATMTPWPTVEAPATNAAQLANAQPPMNNELVIALKRAYPDGLPQDVQDLVDRSSDTAAKQITRDLHAATTSLGKARKALRDAQAAEASHRQAWLKHLREATKHWAEQLDQFRRKQIQFQEAKIRASQEVEAARKLIQALNSQTAAKDAPAMTVEELDDPKLVDTDVKEEEELKKTLQSTLMACAEASGVAAKVTEEITIPSDDEKDGSATKRPRGGPGTPPPSS